MNWEHSMRIKVVLEMARLRLRETLGVEQRHWGRTPECGSPEVSVTTSRVPLQRNAA